MAPHSSTTRPVASRSSITYRYNNDDLRVRKQVMDHVDSDDYTEHYAYDGDQLVLTLDNGGTPKHRYTNGIGIDALLVDEVFDANGDVSDTLWAANDHQGSVRQLLDTGHTIQEHRDYDPFGAFAAVYDETGTTKDLATEALDSAFAFAGREWDDDADLYYNRARYYDPATARFLGEDPAASDANLYRYAGNDPVNYRDPSGLFTGDNAWNYAFDSSFVQFDTSFVDFGSWDFGGLNSLGELFADGIAGAFGALNSGFNMLQESFNELQADFGAVTATPGSKGRIIDKLFPNAPRRDFEFAGGKASEIFAQMNDKQAAAGDPLFTFWGNRYYLPWQEGASLNPLKSVFAQATDQATGKVGGLLVGVNTSIDSASGIDLLVAGGSGLKTGGKAIANSAVSTVTLGTVNEAIAVTDYDRFIGYNYSAASASVSTEIFAGLVTAGASRYGRAGRALLAYDTLGNTYQGGQGVADVYQNGLSLQNSVQIVGSGLGLGGNATAGWGAYRELVNDAGDYGRGLVNLGNRAGDPAKLSSGGLQGLTPRAASGVRSANSSFAYGTKIQRQLPKRGWSDALIDETISTPHHVSPALNKATNNPATAYFRKDGSYVVRENASGRIIQVSDRFKPNWAPDATIQNPYRP